MPDLNKIFEERGGISCREAVKFIQHQIKTPGLKAFSIWMNKTEILSDTDKEKVIRTVKGATLDQTTEIFPEHPYLLETENGGNYFFNSNSVVGSDNIMYNHSSLEALSEKFDKRKGFKCWGSGLVYIPEESVLAKLSISYSDHPGVIGKTVFEARGDELMGVGLFPDLINFIRERKS